MNAHVKSMTLQEKAAQLVFPRFNFSDPEYDAIRSLIKKGVGGLLLQKGSIFDVAPVLNSFQRLAKIPLLTCADLEDGAGGMIAGATVLPSNMAVGATRSADHARRKGSVTAAEARCMGIHMPLTPVMDVNTCPENPIINTRAFGDDPELVSRLGLAFIEGCHQEGALACAKHFPGHGATRIDSHIELPVVDKGLDELEAVELRPFRAAAPVVDSMMTAHLSIPKLDGAVPASLSQKITGDLLRTRLGYSGLVMTDALMMGGVAGQVSEEQALVQAVRAGADVLLYPRDPFQAMYVLEKAVERGEISAEAIDRAVSRILGLKERQGLFQDRIVAVERIEEIVNRSQHQEWARKMAEDSVTRVRDEGGLLSRWGGRSAVHVVHVPAREPKSESVFVKTLRESGVRVETSVPAAPESWCVVALYKRPWAYQDSVAMADEEAVLIRKISETTRNVIAVSFGSPYLLARLGGIGCAVCVYSDSGVSQQAAARALLGQIPMNGQLPVTLGV